MEFTSGALWCILSSAHREEKEALKDRLDRFAAWSERAAAALILVLVLAFMLSLTAAAFCCFRGGHGINTEPAA